MKKNLFVIIVLLLFSSIAFSVYGYEKLTSPSGSTMAPLREENQSELKKEEPERVRKMRMERNLVFQELRDTKTSKDEKLLKLSALERKHYASYDRMRNEIENEKVIERLDVEKVKQIIGACKDDYNAIVKTLMEEHGGADVIRGSGITVFELWLNDDGSDCIFISLMQIYHNNERLF